MSGEIVRQAECSCGQLRVRCRGDSSKVSICHCDACRRRTGSAFGISALYLRSNVAITGESRDFTRNSDAGFPVTLHFCPHCGSTVYWESSRKPDMFGIGIGAFADPAFPMPAQSIVDARRYDWITFPDSMVRRAD